MTDKPEPKQPPNIPKNIYKVPILLWSVVANHVLIQTHILLGSKLDILLNKFSSIITIFPHNIIM